MNERIVVREERLPADTDLAERYPLLAPLFATRAGAVYLAADAEDRPYVVLDERATGTTRLDPLIAFGFTDAQERREWIRAVYAGAGSSSGGAVGDEQDEGERDGGAGMPVAPRPTPVRSGPAATTFDEALDPARCP